MKVAFGPALPVGTAGLREYYDLTLTGYLPADEVQERLAAASVEELAPTRTGYVAEDGPSLSAALTIATYEVVLEAAMGPQALSDGLEEVRETGELVAERKGRTKVYDLTEMLPKKPEVSSRRGEIVVDMTTRMGPAGSLRPETLIRAALEKAGNTEARILVTRTDLRLEEGSDWLRPLG
jgi:radical SAM-linked protein